MKSLCLAECQDITDDSIIEIADRCPNMEIITVLGCDGIDDEDFIVSQLPPACIFKLTYSGDDMEDFAEFSVL
jgi:hypothetical protein